MTAKDAIIHPVLFARRCAWCGDAPFAGIYTLVLSEANVMRSSRLLILVPIADVLRSILNWSRRINLVGGMAGGVCPCIGIG